MEKGSEPNGANEDTTTADEALPIKNGNEGIAAYYDRLRIQWYKSRRARRRLCKAGIKFTIPPLDSQSGEYSNCQFDRAAAETAAETVKRAAKRAAKRANRAARRAAERAAEQVPEAPAATNTSILTDTHPMNPEKGVIHEIEDEEMGYDDAVMNMGMAATITLVYREVSVNEEAARVLILPTHRNLFFSSSLIASHPTHLFINTATHLPHIIMENPPPAGKTPKKKKKRNRSFHHLLRDHGIDVPPVVQGVRDPALPPKRKRNQRRHGRKRAMKRELAADAVAANDNNEPPSSAASSDTAASSPRSNSPVPESSPVILRSHSPSPAPVSGPAPAPSPATSLSSSPKPAQARANLSRDWDVGLVGHILGSNPEDRKSRQEFRTLGAGHVY
ncbi:hypothetical protein N7445_003567 [Penicillium cf. griseofulvum]|nr:hypothetical protein N7445_003567 [Penicillium cf. griseofulvum]